MKQCASHIQVGQAYLNQATLPRNMSSDRIDLRSFMKPRQPQNNLSNSKSRNNLFCEENQTKSAFQVQRSSLAVYSNDHKVNSSIKFFEQNSGPTTARVRSTSVRCSQELSARGEEEQRYQIPMQEAETAMGMLEKEIKELKKDNKELKDKLS